MTSTNKGSASFEPDIFTENRTIDRAEEQTNVHDDLQRDYQSDRLEVSTTTNQKTSTQYHSQFIEYHMFFLSYHYVQLRIYDKNTFKWTLKRFLPSNLITFRHLAQNTINFSAPTPNPFVYIDSLKHVRAIEMILFDGVTFNARTYLREEPRGFHSYDDMDSGAHIRWERNQWSMFEQFWAQILIQHRVFDGLVVFRLPGHASGGTWDGKRATLMSTGFTIMSMRRETMYVYIVPSVVRDTMSKFLSSMLVFVSFHFCDWSVLVQ